MAKHVLIIGANRGIGLSLCQQYIESGYEVTATSRGESESLSKLPCRHLTGIDVSSCESVSGLKSKVSNIDILIHNAGILHGDRFPDVDMENMLEHFNVNSLGPLRTVLALQDCLSATSKIGIVSSRVGSIDDNTSSNNYAYRVSKTAVNMIGKCLSIDLKPKGIAVALLHPGYVRTEMTGFNGLIEPEESAAGLIARMDELTLDTSGIFVHTSGEVLTW